MNRHIKKVQKPIRFTAEEWRDAKKAARLISAERGQLVTPSALVRECAISAARAHIARLELVAA